MVNKKRILIAFAAIIFIGSAGFIFWAYTPLGPSQTAYDSLALSETVLVTIGDRISFKPDPMPKTGLIFYLGDTLTHAHMPHWHMQ